MLTLLYKLKAVLRIKHRALGFFLCMALVSVASATEIVVNQSVPLEHFSLNKTRAIFTMRQRFWSNGKKINVFILADNDPLHKSFAKNNLNMFPHQLRRVWDRMVFSGTGQAPVTLKTEAEMLERIANTPDAIGYLGNRTENEKIRLFSYE